MYVIYYTRISHTHDPPRADFDEHTRQSGVCDGEGFNLSVLWALLRSRRARMEGPLAEGLQLVHTAELSYMVLVLLRCLLFVRRHHVRRDTFALVAYIRNWPIEQQRNSTIFFSAAIPPTTALTRVFRCSSSPRSRRLK